MPSSSSLLNHRLRLAVSSSAGVKTLGAAVQLLAYPIAVQALGIERFGVFVIISSALSWVYLSELGLGLGLTRGIAAAIANDDRDAETKLFATALIMLSIMSLAVIGLGLTAVFIFEADIQALWQEQVLQSETKHSLQVLIAIIGLHIVSTIGTAMRAGYLEQHVSNGWYALGHIISLLSLLLIVPMWPSIPVFIGAIFGAPLLTNLLNTLTLLMLSRPHLRPDFGRFDLATARRLLYEGVGYIILRLSSFLLTHATVLIVGVKLGPAAAAVLAVVQRILTLLTSLSTLITTPIWPAFSSAAANSDTVWVTSASRRLIVGLAGYGLIGGTSIAIGGETLVTLWVGPDLAPPPFLTASMGVYFVLMTWSNAHDVILVGLGRVWSVAIAYAVQSVLVLGVLVVLIDEAGVAAVGIALVIGYALVTSWYMPLKTAATLRPMRAQQ